MKLKIFTCVLIFLCGSTASSQIVTLPVEGITTPADTVTLKATQPTLKSEQSFRIMFRLTSNTGSEVSYAATYFRGLEGWTAFTQDGDICDVDYRDHKNIPVFYTGDNNPRLRRYNGSKASAGVQRPAIVTADFECDGFISAGDYVTVQTRWQYRFDGIWKPADYVFENVQISE